MAPRLSVGGQGGDKEAAASMIEKGFVMEGLRHMGERAEEATEHLVAMAGGGEYDEELVHDALGGLLFHHQLPYNLQTLFMQNVKVEVHQLSDTKKHAVYTQDQPLQQRPGMFVVLHGRVSLHRASDQQRAALAGRPDESPPRKSNNAAPPTITSPVLAPSPGDQGVARKPPDRSPATPESAAMKKLSVLADGGGLSKEPSRAKSGGEGGRSSRRMSLTNNGGMLGGKPLVGGGGASPEQKKEQGAGRIKVAGHKPGGAGGGAQDVRGIGDKELRSLGDAVCELGAGDAFGEEACLSNGLLEPCTRRWSALVEGGAVFAVASLSGAFLEAFAFHAATVPSRTFLLRPCWCKGALSLPPAERGKSELARVAHCLDSVGAFQSVRPAKCVTDMLAAAKLHTFEDGDVIQREGDPLEGSAVRGGRGGAGVVHIVLSGHVQLVSGTSAAAPGAGSGGGGTVHSVWLGSLAKGGGGGGAAAAGVASMSSMRGGPALSLPSQQGAGAGGDSAMSPGGSGTPESVGGALASAALSTVGRVASMRQMTTTTPATVVRALEAGDAICPPNPWNGGLVPLTSCCMGSVETVSVPVSTFFQLQNEPGVLLSVGQLERVIEGEAAGRSTQDLRDIASHISQFSGLDAFPLDRRIALSRSIVGVRMYQRGEVPALEEDSGGGRAWLVVSGQGSPAGLDGSVPGSGLEKFAASSVLGALVGCGVGDCRPTVGEVLEALDGHVSALEGALEGTMAKEGEEVLSQAVGDEATVRSGSVLGVSGLWDTGGRVEGVQGLEFEAGSLIAVIDDASLEAINMFRGGERKQLNKTQEMIALLKVEPEGRAPHELLELTACISEVDLFSSLPESIARELAACSSLASFGGDDDAHGKHALRTVFDAGDTANCFYLVLSGSVSAYAHPSQTPNLRDTRNPRRAAGGGGGGGAFSVESPQGRAKERGSVVGGKRVEVCVATFGEGDSFGVASLEVGYRSWKGRARGKVELMSVPRALFERYRTLFEGIFEMTASTVTCLSAADVPVSARIDEHSSVLEKRLSKMASMQAVSSKRVSAMSRRLNLRKVRQGEVLAVQGTESLKYMVVVDAEVLTFAGLDPSVQSALQLRPGADLPSLDFDEISDWVSARVGAGDQGFAKGFCTVTHDGHLVLEVKPGEAPAIPRAEAQASKRALDIDGVSGSPTRSFVLGSPPSSSDEGESSAISGVPVRTVWNLWTDLRSVEHREVAAAGARDAKKGGGDRDAKKGGGDGGKQATGAPSGGAASGVASTAPSPAAAKSGGGGLGSWAAEAADSAPGCMLVLQFGAGSDLVLSLPSAQDMDSWRRVLIRHKLHGRDSVLGMRSGHIPAWSQLGGESLPPLSGAGYFATSRQRGQADASGSDQSLLFSAKSPLSAVVTEAGHVLELSRVQCETAVREVVQQELLETLDALKKINLIAGLAHLNPSQLQVVGSYLQPRTLMRGESLFHAGGRADALYFVVAGEVALFRPAQGVRVATGDDVGVRGPGTGWKGGSEGRTRKMAHVCNVAAPSILGLHATKPNSVAGGDLGTHLVGGQAATHTEVWALSIADVRKCEEEMRQAILSRIRDSHRELLDAQLGEISRASQTLQGVVWQTRRKGALPTGRRKERQVSTHVALEEIAKSMQGAAGEEAKWRTPWRAEAAANLGFKEMQVAVHWGLMHEEGDLGWVVCPRCRNRYGAELPRCRVCGKFKGDLDTWRQSGLKRSEEKQAKGLSLVAQQTIELLHQQASASRAETAPPAEFQQERASAAPPSTAMHGPRPPQAAASAAQPLALADAEGISADAGGVSAPGPEMASGGKPMVQQSSSFYSEAGGEAGEAEVLTVGHEGSVEEAAHNQLSADLTQVASQLTQEVSSASQLPYEASFASLAEQPSSLGDASLDEPSASPSTGGPGADDRHPQQHRHPAHTGRAGANMSPPADRRPRSPTSPYPPNSPTSHHVKLEALPDPPLQRVGSYGRATPSSPAVAPSALPKRSHATLFLPPPPARGAVFRSSSPAGGWASPIRPHRSHSSIGHRRSIADVIPSNRGLRSSGLSSRGSDGRGSPTPFVQQRRPRFDLPARSHIHRASEDLQRRSASPFGAPGERSISPRWAHFVPLDSKISSAAIHQGHPRAGQRAVRSFKGARLEPL